MNTAKLTVTGNGTYTVKTSAGITIGNEKYSVSYNVDFKASKNSSSIINGTVKLENNTDRFKVKVTNGKAGVNVTFKNGAVISITGLSDGGFVDASFRRYTRKGKYIFLQDGKIFDNISNNTKLLGLVDGYSTAPLTSSI